jgi:type II secretory pathway pseudopilin PulG
MTKAQKKKTLGLAITSLVFGCLFLIPFLGFLFSLAAIVLGIIALVSISKNKETIKGQGLAIAGIVLGSIGVIVIPIIAITTAIFVPTVLKSSEKARMESAKVALRAIATAYESYYVDNNKYPTSIADVKEADPPYLEYETIDFASKNYHFNCDTTDSHNYICTATPSECDVTGTKIFKINNSFEIYEEDCK